MHQSIVTLVLAKALLLSDPAAVQDSLARQTEQAAPAVNGRPTEQPLQTESPIRTEAKNRASTRSGGERLQAEIEAAAAELVAAGTDAFQRSLMPLDDYLEQLGVVSSLELRLAGQRDDRRRQLAAAQRAVERLEQAVRRLERFRQPAAHDWLADTLLAQAALAEARRGLADLQQNRAMTAAYQAEFQDLAEDYFELRSAQHSLGLCPLPKLVAAAARRASADSSAGASDAARFDEVSVAAVRLTRVWNALGAGVGRIDRLQQVEFDAAVAASAQAAYADDRVGFAAGIAQADETAQQMLESTIGFYRQGTASLADVTHAWLLRRHVQDWGAQAEGVVSDEMNRSRRDELSRIVGMADDVTDLRGRHAADVQFVRLLDLAEAVDKPAAARR